MSNTFTNQIQDAYAAIEIVNRESVGFIPRVTRSASEVPAFQGTVIRNPVWPASTPASITPAATPPAFTDVTTSNRNITMDTLIGDRFHYTGEEQGALQLTGIYPSLFSQAVGQIMRSCVNNIEAALGNLYYGMFLAHGTAGTTPFATDLSDLAYGKKLLNDRGAPKNDRHCVIDSTAGYNLGKLTQLTNVNQAGDNMLLREGEYGRLQGFDVAESEGIASHTPKGTGTSYELTAAEAIGQTTIGVDTGSGTILQGDVITHASDTTNKYVVKTTLAAGELAINSPGLLIAGAENDAVTVGNVYTANMMFHRSALSLATRPPRMPDGGDVAINEEIIADPVSGLTFRLAEYKGYHGNQFEVSILYGVAPGKSENGLILMG